VHLRGAGDMHDQGMIGRPTFRGKNFGNRIGVGSIGAQSVYGFGRKGDQLALPQQFDGVADGFFGDGFRIQSNQAKDENLKRRAADIIVVANSFAKANSCKYIKAIVMANASFYLSPLGFSPN